MKTTLKQLARALLLKLGQPSARLRRQREAILASPFPRPWTRWLETRSAHYQRLPKALRDRFREQMQIFLAEKRITGVEMKVGDEEQLLVAASAVSLTVGWPGYTWDQLSEVLLYPDDFDRDYNFGPSELAGQAHPWGVVIVSAPALHRSFDRSDYGYHVGFHEFAHLLDLAHTRFDGIPSYLDDDSIRRWTKIVRTEEDRLRRADSVLDPYGLSNSVEFFATAVEAFFQIPLEMADRHRELYSFLSDYFCQDPASWSSRSSG